MINEWLILSGSLFAGVVLGLLFFGGLWWTVRRGVASAQIALWFFCSLLLRSAIVMVGFWLVGGADWQRWAALLLGFILARIVVTRVTRKMPVLIGAQYAP